MPAATEKQLKYLRYLVREADADKPDWDHLTKKQASQLIDQLRLEVEAARRLRQTELPLPPPEPVAPDDPSVPPEVVEFKRWAREVFQRGDQNILQLCELYKEKFGDPLLKA